VDTTKTITHLSLCSGYEGIGLGLRDVLPNLREIAYVEREGFPISNLVAKMEAGELDSAPIFTDVKTFPYGEFRGQVDILSGGFPCQPFSAAGKRKATDDPRHLFPYIADGIRDCQPRIVFLENVAGIISAKTADGESVLQYVLRELEGLGYRATAGIFSAEEVGAPHQRKRVFILGMANSEDIGRRGRTHRDGDDKRGLQEQEAQEQSNLRSETAGCSGDSRGELGDTDSKRCEGERLRIQQRQEGQLPGRSSEELANSNRGRGEIQDQRQLASEQVLERNGSSRGAWPSRPGEPQYEWEEPRVVADSKSQQGSPGNNGGEQRASSQSEEVQLGGGHSGSLRESNGQAESQLGRAPNGSTSRVDRLRLLGNGVVPATASKAFLTLIQRITTN